MKKKIIFSSLLLILSFYVFSLEGIMAGQHDLCIVKTERFDIIYAPESADSAKILVEKADGLYSDLAQKFNIKNHFRMPVVISPAIDTFNAYFSSFPFSHIVIFDTLPERDMAVFAETFLNTFRHELIHAITYNDRNDNWFKIDKALGDVYNPALLTITTAWAEGAAVSLESEYGEGRMNSEYSLQILKQAKIDGCFPKYSEIQGARDVYPSTTMSYIFGGAFCRWLQQKYGMEKYAEFWYRCVNFKSYTYFGCFKKVYKKSIEKAWQEFYDSIEIPDGIEIKKTKRKALSAYESLTACSGGYAYIDIYKTGVFFKRNGNKKARLIFSQTSLKSINLSSDGAYMAVSYTDDSYANGRGRVYVYDMKKKSSFYIKGIGLRQGEVFKSGTDYYVAYEKTISEFSTLVIERLLRNKNGRIYGTELVKEFPLKYGEQIFSLEGACKLAIDGMKEASSEELYFVRKSGSKFLICRYSVGAEGFDSIELPDGIAAYSMCSNANKIYFSYADHGMIPRLGILTLGAGSAENHVEIELSQTDLSGGILYPVQNEEKIVYIASYLNGYKIQEISVDKMDFKKISVAVRSFESADGSVFEDNKKAEDLDSFEIEGSKKFSAFAYTFKGPKGTFAPASLTNTYSVSDAGDVLKTVSLPLGITYLSSTPWTYPIYYFSAGYGLFSNSYAFEAGIYRGGTTNGLFNYKGSANVEFDNSGYKQVHCGLKATSKIPLFRTFYFSLSDTAQFLQGRQSKSMDKMDNFSSLGEAIGILNKENQGEDLSIRRIYASNKFSFEFGNIHKAGRGYFNQAGFKIGPSLNMTFCSKDSDLDYQFFRFENIAIDCTAKIPGIMPVTLEASLFPSIQYVGYALARIVLLSAEIQKSTDFLPLIYLNRITLSAEYMGKFKEQFYMPSWPLARAYKYINHVIDGKTDYYDEFSLIASIYFTPNIGGLARPDFQIKASGGLVYRFCPEPDEKTLGLTVGVTIGNFFSF
ncbi:MAG: hypothetical protein IJL70_00345 [Treponema sp.]|nr:hypothetical protein [Treponema sp.]